MAITQRLRQLLPIAVAVAIIVLAARVLAHTFRHTSIAGILRQLHAIAAPQLVIVLYATLATYEAIVARVVAGPVSSRRAMLGALLAASIGHVVGWGAVSGGAIRYRLYSAVQMRPLDIGKMVLLAAMPYPVGLGLLLGLSLALQSAAAAPILHVPPDLARGTGLALLALHAAYVTLIVNRRAPLIIGRFLLTLPPPPLTAVQYCAGIIEVCCGAGILYALMPEGLAPPFVVFVGIYVLSILAGLASSVPAGIGVFEAMIVTLLPDAPQDLLIATVVAYRFVLEFVPAVTAILLFVAYEGWWRLPAQRARRTPESERRG
jgi:phosphatidylglycerol lysyltransferase